MTDNNIIEKQSIPSNKLYMNLINAATCQSSLRHRNQITTTQTWKQSNPVEQAQKTSDLYDPTGFIAPPLKPEKVPPKKTLGKGWFDLEPAKLDENLRRDMKIIQMRNYLDPRRFYKNPDKLGTVLHVGTVIEGVGEFKSARLTNKERKQTIVDEIMADSRLRNYSKRKYDEIQVQKANKRKIRAPLRKKK